MNETKPVLDATLETITPAFFGVAEIDGVKVAEIEKRLIAGGSIPPVVVIKYDDRFMPIDGHHRLTACRNLGITIAAWVVDGEAFEDADHDPDYRAEELIRCGGVHWSEVASY